MGLQDLQPELIIQICQNLCHHCLDEHDPPLRELWPQDPEAKTYRHALLDLSLSCRKVGSIAQEVLHHHCGFFETTDSTPFYFCRTISGNPHLAKEVRFLNFKRIRTLPSIEEAQPWLPDVVEKFRSLLVLPGQPATFDNNYMRLKDAIAPMVFLQTPLLQHLSVAGSLSWTFFNQFNLRAVLQSGRLPQHLKGLAVGQFRDGAMNPNAITHLDLSLNETGGYFYAFKKLDYVHLNNLLGSSITRELSLENVRVLRMCDARLSMGQLRILLQITKRLQEFAYMEGVVPGAHLGTAISSQDMFEVLAVRNDTLERAVLFVGFGLERPVAASALTNLRELKISAHALFDFLVLPGQQNPELDQMALMGVFPPSIQTLQVSANWWDLSRIKHAFAYYVLSTCGSKTEEQKLRRVVINYMLSHGDTEDGLGGGRSPEQVIRLYKTFFTFKCQRWLREGTFEFFKGSRLWHQIGLGKQVAVCRAFGGPDLSRLTLED
ncbi:hypothetical protein ACJ41O_003904 [Fusarium nematophilum]